jgi:hypothetical protein
MAMRKVLLALLLVGFCLSLYAFTHLKRIRRQTNLNLASVSAIFPVDQNGVTKAIIKMFREGKPPPTGKFSHFSLAQVGEEQFPADYQLSNHQEDESMRRYVSIDPARRRLDFYLYDFSDADDRKDYWMSDYYRGSDPVPFRCNFIIHHEPEGPDHTKVEIFEFAPRVWVGKKFGLGPHGPGYYLDIRNVDPTTSDRVELLALLKEALQKSAAFRQE